jgi:hypothetical protein
MHSALADLLSLNTLQPSEAKSFHVGQLVRVTAEGRALVDYPDNLMGPIEARSIIELKPTHVNLDESSLPVLLVFENGDPTLPIVIGIVRDTLYPPAPLEEATISVERPRDVVLDGRTIALDAKEEIVLRCGKSSITLRKDGKIVVKGTQLVSRSSGSNKIKGATVSIN